MKHQYTTGTLVVLAIFFVLSVGYCIWQHIKDKRKANRNNGDDLAKWHGLTDKDFNKN